MGEFLGWMIVLGLALAIGCSFVLSSHLEQDSHHTMQAIFHDSEMLRARLEQRAGPSEQTSARLPERPAGVVLELRPTGRSRQEDLLSV